MDRGVEEMKRSDIDLAIECRAASSENWNKILLIIEEADTLLSIDCVRLDKIQNEKFKQAVLRDGKILFERNAVNSLRDALERLHEVLEIPIDQHRIIIDATIKRFEFTFELFLKTMKRRLALEGIDVKSPRQTLQKAYELSWIDDEQLWLSMMNDRNETSHVYDEEKAHEIYKKSKTITPTCKKPSISILDKKLFKNCP